MPDLIVEVLSPSTRSTDLGKKLRAYEAAGIPEYWVAEVVRPGMRTFAFMDGRYEEIEPTGGLLASTIIPGLVIDPIALHEAALWASE